MAEAYGQRSGVGLVMFAWLIPLDVRRGQKFKLTHYLAIAGLDLSAAIYAEIKGIPVEYARIAVFAPLHGCIDEATAVELKAALELVRSAPAGGNTTAQGLEAIGSIITRSGSIIWQGLSLAFAKVQSALKTACNWSLARARTIDAYLKTNTFPWIASNSMAVWNWTSSSVVAVSKSAWTGIRCIANAAWTAMSFVCNAVVSVLQTIDHKLGDLVMSMDCMKTMTANVAISKPCNISLPFVVYFASAGITYIRVTMVPGTGQWALLKREIAGFGVICN